MSEIKKSPSDSLEKILNKVDEEKLITSLFKTVIPAVLEEKILENQKAFPYQTPQELFYQSLAQAIDTTRLYLPIQKTRLPEAVLPLEIMERLENPHQLFYICQKLDLVIARCKGRENAAHTPKYRFHGQAWVSETAFGPWTKELKKYPYFSDGYCKTCVEHIRKEYHLD